MDKLDKILTIVIIIGNFIIAITNYLYGMSSHDAYYMSEGIFNLIIGFGLILINKKDTILPPKHTIYQQHIVCNLLSITFYNSVKMLYQ